ncbi:MAG: hypothetical protein JWQ02_4282 [Capsulimonas sp.]|nr:hypothetical protein [Capsulimonas sp.]
MQRLFALLLIGVVFIGNERGALSANSASFAHSKNTMPYAFQHHPKPPPDPFAWAVNDQSTGSYYVLITIADDNTGQSRKCCVATKFLVGAMMSERHLDYSNGNEAKVRHTIIINQARAFHFSNTKALDNVRPRYSEELLSAVRRRMAQYSDAQIVKRFRSRNTSEFYHSFGKSDGWDRLDYAVAHVLLERGFFVRSGDFFDGVHVYTVQDIQKEQEMYEDGERQIKENNIKANSVARQIPGYGDVTKYFTISSPSFSDNGLPSDAFDCWLTRPGSFLVGDARWTNPVVVHKTVYSWSTFLKNYRTASHIAMRQPWLARWKRQYSGSITFISFGDSTHEGPDDIASAKKAWRKGGLKGSPAFQYHLDMPNHGDGEVYLNAAGYQALVYSPDDPEAYMAKEDPEYKSRPQPVPKSRAEQARLGVYFRPASPTLKGYQEYYVVEPLHGK